jgi:16S rRNA (uracil1498-N3)-methyltransferase
MQLFITPNYIQDKANIKIIDTRIVHQCFHVLRYKPTQIIQIQNQNIRYTVEITDISKKEMLTKIQEEETITTNNNKQTTLIIALPNRRDKAELIVQKLTEIGIDHIMFWKAERSTLRDFSDKKLQRLQTISLEAAEQAFRRALPTITYLDNLFENPILSSGQIVLFHQN